MFKTARAWVDVWLELAKPRIILLLAITALAGALVGAKGNLPLLQMQTWPIVWGMLGLVLSAAGANMVNMWWDRDIDPLMKRTKGRPLPTGRVTPRTVLAVAIGLIASGFGVAWLGANLTSGLMALAGALFYVFVYTLWLKRRTVQNIVIGGAAGAFPPLVGWAAVQGNVADPLAWLMFAIIFLWTPPHFWALALMINDDYKNAHVPMYPVVHGEPATRLAIVRYLLLLVPVTLLGGLFAPLGWIYMTSAVGLGLWWGWSAYMLLQSAKTTKDDKGPARVVFLRSLTYLALLFLAMVIDCWL